MMTFLIALGVFLVALSAMAVGVLVSNRRIKGSCGGLAGFEGADGRSICDACSDPSPECRGDRASSAAAEAAQSN